MAKKSVMNAKNTAYNRACKDGGIYVRWKGRDGHVNDWYGVIVRVFNADGG